MTSLTKPENVPTPVSVQVAPPSTDLYKPEPKKKLAEPPLMATYRVWALATFGSTTKAANSAKSNFALARKLQVFPASSERRMPPPGPEAAARTILEFPGNTTRSCSWIASDRICGWSVSGVHVGDESIQLLVFQTPPLLEPRYITLELLGSGAATSTRPPKGGPVTGAGPMGVHWFALKVTDGEGPLTTRSTRRPTISKMANEMTTDLLRLRVKDANRRLLVFMILLPRLDFGSAV